MLPTLSRLSVRKCPETRLRHRCSSRSLHISPLHREFQSPLHPSRTAVSADVLRLSRRISRPTCHPAYAPFTPSNSEQRLPPLSYRLCLTAAAGTELAGASSAGTVRCRRLSRRHPSFPLTVVYDPKAFVPHAASLRQAFAHCGKFPTAASRRSRGRVSVPVWLVVLSDQLPVIALVGRYPAN